MIRAHKIRLNPTPEQATYFAKAVGTRRFAFNWGLAEWKRQHENGQKPSAMALKKQFNAIKSKQFPWVYEVTKSAVEGAFADLGQAFTNFFEGLKRGRKVGYPRFKAKKRSNESFYLANDRFSVEGHSIHISKLGTVNMTEALRFTGKMVSATVSMKAGWWFVSIRLELPNEIPERCTKAVGIDVGIKRLATLSDGTWFENQKPLRGLLGKLKRLNQALARKQKGSTNREKARLKVARLHYRVACIRDDILHKLTTFVAGTYGFVGVETLHVKGMIKNRTLAQALSDAALGRLLKLLRSKVIAQGGVVQEVGRFFPSSKCCSTCGHVKAKLMLSEREFICDACGVTLDRDHNASLNILNEALRLFESSQNTLST
jgi:putative transposase